jgi:hypothetical protein
MGAWAGGCLGPTIIRAIPFPVGAACCILPCFLACLCVPSVLGPMWKDDHTVYAFLLGEGWRPVYVPPVDNA